MLASRLPQADWPRTVDEFPLPTANHFAQALFIMHAPWLPPQAQRANAGGGGAARREALELMEASVKVGVPGGGRERRARQAR